VARNRAGPQAVTPLEGVGAAVAAVAGNLTVAGRASPRSSVQSAA